jgi:undecaprenyl pyrophosphate phosphatase UppP
VEAGTGTEEAGEEALSDPVTSKTVVDEFMLKEYESIAAAHFDSQEGLRQQFRFYLLLAAVPITILGLAFKDQQTKNIEQFDLLNLPRFLGYSFIAVGILGVMMLLAMIHTALDATLYARTVNGVRAFFSARGKESGVDLSPYLLMPLATDKPRYFRLRSFFWQVVLIAAVNTAYIAVPAYAVFGSRWRFPLLVFLAQIGMYRLICWLRELRPATA